MPRTEESAEGFPVDASIVDIIDRLRAHGYETTHSCSGLGRDHPERIPEDGTPEFARRSGYVQFFLGNGNYEGQQAGFPLREIEERDSLDPISEQYRDMLKEFQNAAAAATGEWDVEFSRFEGKEKITLRNSYISKSDDVRMEEWESLCEVLESRQIQS